MTSRDLTVTTPDGDMPAHLWTPESGSGPGLLLVQEIFGVSRYIRQRAEDLAALGYVVLAPEIYWRIGHSSVPEGPDALERAYGLMQQLDWEAAVSDAAAALEVLRERPEVSGRVGAIGFCFGGGLAYAVAGRHPVDALVSYYGSALPDLVVTAPEVAAPQLHHFGTADQFIDGDAVERVRTTLEGPGTTFVLWEGADHAFDNPDLPFHHPDASSRAWDCTVTWLGEHLPVR